MSKRMLSALRACRFGPALLATALLGLVTAGFSTVATAGMGKPTPRQIDLQDSATDMAREIHLFHDKLLIVITAITIFVMLLLLWVMLRFNEKANPNPSKTTHSTALEVAWTIIPILVLLYISIPSFRLLYKQYEFPKPDVTIKSTGHQWNWTHEYVDNGVSMESLMLNEQDRAARIKATGLPESELPRLLAVDNEIVVPVNKVVHVLVTATDVIHAWQIPSFGAHTDAVPGRITATYFKANTTGMFYGQCSQLCGKDHAFMPIAVRVVPDGVYTQWLAVMSDKTLKKQEKLEKARGIVVKAALEDLQNRKVASK